jgi:hypothetical protein
MGNITLNGSTSGQITLAPTAVAGANTITLPAATGTLLTTAGGQTISGTTTANNLTVTGTASLTAPTITSGINFTGSTSGTTALIPSAVASGTLTLPAGTGTVTVKGASSNIVLGTTQTATGGTAVSFTGIPSWVNRVTINFNGFVFSPSSSGSALILYLGTGSGPTYASSGYNYGLTWIQSSSPSATNYNTGFFALVFQNYTGSDTLNGSAILSNMGSNSWAIHSIIGASDTARASHLGGAINLGATLTAIQISTPNGTNTFSSGSVNIMYE